MTTLSFRFRRRLWAWLTPLLCVAANLVFLSVYQVSYAGRVDLLFDQSNAESRTLENSICPWSLRGTRCAGNRHPIVGIDRFLGNKR